MRGAIAALLLAVFAGCDRGDAVHDAEVAAELRAMRAALANSKAAPAVDATVMKQTFAPLREAVQTLLSEQAALAQRQLALTQELQRWTQVVASGVAASGAAAAQGEEVQALRVRLGELEAALQAEQTQRAAVEKVVQSALDRTADQLGALLQLLQVRPAAPAEEPQATPAPDKTDAQPPASDQQGAEQPSRDAASDPAAVWLALLAFTGLAMLWLWVRRPRRRQRAMHADEQPGLDRGVEEIWAAAELLGEAVGRLRQSNDGDAIEAATVADALALPDEAIAVQPSLQPPVQLPVPAPLAIDFAEQAAFAVKVRASQPEPQAATRRQPPPTALFVVPLRGSQEASAIHALQQLLAADPRVLRRPSPEIVAADGRVAVRCCLLPSLHAGEQAHLEQCLRDAVA